MRQTIQQTLVIFAAAGAATLGLRSSGLEGAEDPAVALAPVLPEVLTVHPRRDHTARLIRLPATAEPSEQALLYARVNGFIKERNGELGDKVTTGQVLAVIENPDLVWNSERAKATLAQNEARLILARANLARSERLIDKNAVSRETLETRQAEEHAAQANRDAAAAEARRLSELLEFREIRAPFDGIIVERRAERGDLAAGDQPQPNAYLFRLAKIDTLRVVVNVPQSDVRRVEGAKTAQVRFLEFPGAPVKGQISRISKFIDAGSGTMRVEIMLPNPGESISAGMFAQAEFSDVSETALRLPSNAIVSRKGVPHVAVVENGRIRFAPIRLGHDLGTELEVLDGVVEGDGVVINPSGLLQEGETVAATAKKAS
jgi:membrane fusion protein, multidrug efflux system